MSGQHGLERRLDTDPEFRRRWFEHKRRYEIREKLQKARREEILRQYSGSKQEIGEKLAEVQKSSLLDLGLSEQNVKDLVMGVDAEAIQVFTGEVTSVPLDDFVYDKTIERIISAQIPERFKTRILGGNTVYIPSTDRYLTFDDFIPKAVRGLENPAELDAAAGDQLNHLLMGLGAEVPAAVEGGGVGAFLFEGIAILGALVNVVGVGVMIYAAAVWAWSWFGSSNATAARRIEGRIVDYVDLTESDGSPYEYPIAFRSAYAMHNAGDKDRFGYETHASYLSHAVGDAAEKRERFLSRIDAGAQALNLYPSKVTIDSRSAGDATARSGRQILALVRHKDGCDGSPPCDYVSVYDGRGRERFLTMDSLKYSAGLRVCLVQALTTSGDETLFHRLVFADFAHTLNMVPPSGEHSVAVPSDFCLLDLYGAVEKGERDGVAREYVLTLQSPFRGVEIDGKGTLWDRRPEVGNELGFITYSLLHPVSHGSTFVIDHYVYGTSKRKLPLKATSNCDSLVVSRVTSSDSHSASSTSLTHTRIFLTMARPPSQELNSIEVLLRRDDEGGCTVAGDAVREIALSYERSVHLTSQLFVSRHPWQRARLHQTLGVQSSSVRVKYLVPSKPVVGATFFIQGPLPSVEEARPAIVAYPYSKIIDQEIVREQGRVFYVFVVNRSVDQFETEESCVRYRSSDWTSLSIDIPCPEGLLAAHFPDELPDVETPEAQPFAQVDVRGTLTELPLNATDVRFLDAGARVHLKSFGESTSLRGRNTGVFFYNVSSDHAIIACADFGRVPRSDAFMHNRIALQGTSGALPGQGVLLFWSGSSWVRSWLFGRTYVIESAAETVVDLSALPKGEVPIVLLKESGGERTLRMPSRARPIYVFNRSGKDWCLVLEGENSRRTLALAGEATRNSIYFLDESDEWTLLNVTSAFYREYLESDRAPERALELTLGSRKSMDARRVFVTWTQEGAVAGLPVGGDLSLNFAASPAPRVTFSRVEHVDYEGGETTCNEWCVVFRVQDDEESFIPRLEFISGALAGELSMRLRGSDWTASAQVLEVVREGDVQRRFIFKDLRARDRAPKTLEFFLSSNALEPRRLAFVVAPRLQTALATDASAVWSSSRRKVTLRLPCAAGSLLFSHLSKERENEESVTWRLTYVALADGSAPSELKFQYEVELEAERTASSAPVMWCKDQLGTRRESAQTVERVERMYRKTFLFKRDALEKPVDFWFEVSKKIEEGVNTSAHPAIVFAIPEAPVVIPPLATLPTPPPPTRTTRLRWTQPHSFGEAPGVSGGGPYVDLVFPTEPLENCSFDSWSRDVESTGTQWNLFFNVNGELKRKPYDFTLAIEYFNASSAPDLSVRKSSYLRVVNERIKRMDVGGSRVFTLQLVDAPEKKLKLTLKTVHFVETIRNPWEGRVVYYGGSDIHQLVVRPTVFAEGRDAEVFAQSTEPGMLRVVWSPGDSTDAPASAGFCELICRQAPNPHFRFKRVYHSPKDRFVDTSGYAHPWRIEYDVEAFKESDQDELVLAFRFASHAKGIRIATPGEQWAFSEATMKGIGETAHTSTIRLNSFKYKGSGDPKVLILLVSAKDLELAGSPTITFFQRVRTPSTLSLQFPLTVYSVLSSASHENLEMKFGCWGVQQQTFSSVLSLFYNFSRDFFANSISFQRVSSEKLGGLPPFKARRYNYGRFVRLYVPEERREVLGASDVVVHETDDSDNARLTIYFRQKRLFFDSRKTYRLDLVHDSWL